MKAEAVGALVIAITLSGGLVWLLRQIQEQQWRLRTRLTALEGTLAARTARDEGTTGLPAAGAAGAKPAPPFVLPDLDGRAISLATLLAPGRPLLLAFTDPRCTPCPEILPDLARWGRSPALTLALISTGSVEANRQHVASTGLAPVLLQRELELVTAYGVEMAPAAVVIRPDGTLDGSPTYGPDAIRQLGAHLAGEAPPQAADAASPLTVGDVAPALHGSGLDGRPLNLAAFRGRPLLVLFWNPSCGSCQGLASQVRAWAADVTMKIPPMLLVARGTVEENRTMDLPVPTLLDPDLALARVWGVNGTPWAYLLDEEGRVAAPMARGAIGVLELVARAVQGRIAQSTAARDGVRDAERSIPSLALGSGAASETYAH